MTPSVAAPSIPLEWRAGYTYNLGSSDFDAFLSVFNSELSQVIPPNPCTICTKLLGVTINRRGICNKCTADRSPCKLFSSENNMTVRPLPCAAFIGLTMAEMLCISPILCTVQVVQCKGYGQYSARGHIVNLEQDIESIVSSLPRLKLPLIYLVKRDTRREAVLRVRRGVVAECLLFLKQNNPYFRDINIDSDALRQLPSDDLFPGADVRIDTDGSDSKEGLENFHNCGTVNATHNKLMRDFKQQVLDEKLTYPSVGGRVNEFSKPGYMNLCFPYLDPYADIDYHRPRARAIEIADYFHHLMTMKDARFRRHPSFKFFALNTSFRWRLLRNSRIFIHQHPSESRLTADEMRNKLASDNSFVKQVIAYSANIKGTDAYWFQQRCQLEFVVET